MFLEGLSLTVLSDCASLQHMEPDISSSQMSMFKGHIEKITKTQGGQEKAERIQVRN